MSGEDTASNLNVEESIPNPEYYDVESESEAVSEAITPNENKDSNGQQNRISTLREELGQTKGAASEAEDQADLQESTGVTMNTTNAVSIAEERDERSSLPAGHDIDYLHDEQWRMQRKHIFVLSDAGKPIYSLHGDEEKLASLCGVIQALVSFVQHGQDSITSINARGIRFVFMVKNNLILVAVCRMNWSIAQIQMQLSDVYNQILSILTNTHLSKIFEKRKNFDLRRMLAGSERLIHHLVTKDSSSRRINNSFFNFLTNTVRILPLPLAVRTTIGQTIKEQCSNAKNLVFVLLIADNSLVVLVHRHSYFINVSDLRLIMNLVESSESFKTSENWTPLCLPRFDMNGYLYAHVSYLTDECPACLILLSVDRNDFFVLSEMKKQITDKLGRQQCLKAINEAIPRKLSLSTLGLLEVRHFLYKPKGSAQLLYPDLQPPYNNLECFEHLEDIYCGLLKRVHNTNRPLKLIFEAKSCEVVLSWLTASYELHMVFEPLVEKKAITKHVEKFIKWINKEYDVYFINNHPDF